MPAERHKRQAGDGRADRPLKSAADQQQPASPHPQDGSVPVSMPVMIAAAQPTPAFTESAPKSQFFAQAPHSMQRSRSVTTARFSRISNTPCGQTSTHRPHPAHFPAS